MNDTSVKPGNAEKGTRRAVQLVSESVIITRDTSGTAETAGKSRGQSHVR